jgi:hypothetical protein
MYAQNFSMAFAGVSLMIKYWFTSYLGVCRILLYLRDTAFVFFPGINKLDGSVNSMDVRSNKCNEWVLNSFSRLPLRTIT